MSDKDPNRSKKNASLANKNTPSGKYSTPNPNYSEERYQTYNPDLEPMSKTEQEAYRKTPESKATRAKIKEMRKAQERKAHATCLSWKDMPAGYRDLPPDEQKIVWEQVEAKFPGKKH